MLGQFSMYSDFSLDFVKINVKKNAARIQHVQAENIS